MVKIRNFQQNKIAAFKKTEYQICLSIYPAL
jgi:hypothetical protein